MSRRSCLTTVLVATLAGATPVSAQLARSKVYITYRVARHIRNLARD